jgi:decaprenylphospho-beta-D-ribofuranose 2-oxidase
MRPHILAGTSNARSHADWLQEYFVAGPRLAGFLEFLKGVLEANGVCVLNASVRFVKRDRLSALPYAHGDRFGVVLYFNQSLAPRDVRKTQAWVREVEARLASAGDAFYLPYVQFATREQFERCFVPRSAAPHPHRAEPRLFDSGFRQQYLAPLPATPSN